jgi:hypothetical protein
MTIEPNRCNNYSYELIGIIEFHYPQSKDYTQQNICFYADWGILDKEPNVLI